MRYYAGVDIGATTAKLGLLREDGHIVGERHDVPSSTIEGPDACVQRIAKGLDELLKKSGVRRDELVSMGASFPTPINADGNVMHPTNINASWKGKNVRQLFENSFSLAVVLLNDGDAAAYREYSLRAKMGKKCNIMAQFITGTGLGGAVIVRGEILRGTGSAVAAELGHVVTDTTSEADRCGCGALGCAETRASLKGLLRLAQKYAHECTENITPVEWVKRFRKLIQNPSPPSVVQKIWKEYFTHLGRAIRTVANVVGCDVVVLSGGAQECEADTRKTYETFLAQAIQWIRDEVDVSFPHLRSMTIEWSIDEIADAAVYGAAAYSKREQSLLSN